ncbi:MAG: aminotransferase class I/II-fold pyridoxal phosphate-dependent enzyme [Dehalococcoidia bacterium]|nr:aminotransferase class I/II-fold pyridoxal phosphate-dependent enzyme [Dehalococcoidia bacterium]MDH4299219.1 aminotransferase class I/II-fold pyridoxal phosphate-dependent enzyme [Dehalococcoidia bacterium]MDH4367525.1 aminotransferase class I/II-fold pyridoxal phosphate-dependent enzyme [Dehalococcoidia bacterium]
MPNIRSTSTEAFDNLISQKVATLPPSGIRKFFDLLSSIEDVISLGIGEPDFVTPWHIREAGIYSLEKGYTMYTSNSGMPELRQELACYLELHYGVSYNPEHEILVTAGSSEGLDLVLRAIINPGDEVIIPDPCYVAYPADITLAGGMPIPVPTDETSNFVVRATDIEARITKRTKAILIGYPANPTGAVMSKKEADAIAELSRKQDLLIISDEIYARLIYGAEHICFPSLPGMKKRTILISGFSKSHAMTGWRIGYVAADRRFIQALTKIHQYTLLCAPTMTQMAAIEALRNGEGEVEKMVQEYNRRRRFMVKRLNEIGLPCFEPKGAFFTFPSVKATGMHSEDFAEKLLLEQKVAVVPGTAFGPSGEGFVRCCYATSLPNIEEALRRMDRFVSKGTRRSR